MSLNVQGIGDVGSLYGIGAMETAKPFNTVRTNSQIFDDFLESAKGIFNQTNKELNNLEELQLKIATGESEDFVGLSLAQAKSNTTMQFFVQSTTKVVEAYREIMRMQI